MLTYRKYIYFVLSVIILVVLAQLIIIGLRSAYPSTNYGFNLYVSTIVFHYTSLAAGVTLILLRLFGVVRNRYAFYYNFIGSCNCWAGILYFFVLPAEQHNTGFLLSFLCSIFCGMIIVMDIVLDE